MKLKVPLIIQKHGSEECWLACLAMLLKFYNIQEDSKNLSKVIKVSPWIWTYMPQLWIYLLKKWFDVEIISLNQHLFTCKHKNLSSEKLIKHFLELSKQTKDINKKKSLQFFVEFVKEWWKIKVDIPSYKDIETEISKNRPLISLMTSRFISSTIHWFNFHFNLITWIDSKSIYVNDPLPDHTGGKKKYAKNLYMYAIYSTAYADIDNASIMKIRKK